MFHSLQFNFIENFMPWLRLWNLWLLTMGSQGEAKCYTKEFNGSQEAKGLWSQNNIRMKTRPLTVNLWSRPIIHFHTIFHSFLLKLFMPWLPFSNLWLMTMGSQGEAKSETKELNGSQEAKGLWTKTNILTKTTLSDVKPPIEANRL